jgi:hypothetical protein
MSTAFLQRAAERFAPPARHQAHELMEAANMTPDPWQADLMRERRLRELLLCSRQAGKSMTVAAIALEQALMNAGTLTLLISPSQRQSRELLGKVRQLATAQPVPLAMEQLSELSMKLANGSRIVAVPGRAEFIRGFAADLIVLEEAAWISDQLYQAIRPMLAVSGGRLIALTTPFGKRGWFFHAWASDEEWHRVKVTAHEVPRIAVEFLAEEKRSMPPNVFAAEYECQFSDTIDSVFSSDDVMAALTDDVQPLFGDHAQSTTLDNDIEPLFLEAS